MFIIEFHVGKLTSNQVFDSINLHSHQILLLFPIQINQIACDIHFKKICKLKFSILWMRKFCQKNFQNYRMDIIEYIENTQKIWHMIMKILITIILPWSFLVNHVIEKYWEETTRHWFLLLSHSILPYLFLLYIYFICQVKLENERKNMEKEIKIRKKAKWKRKRKFSGNTFKNIPLVILWMHAYVNELPLIRTMHKQHFTDAGISSWKQSVGISIYKIIHTQWNEWYQKLFIFLFFILKINENI